GEPGHALGDQVREEIFASGEVGVNGCDNHRFAAIATVVVVDRERHDLMDRFAAENPGWSQYRAMTSREIPVIALTPCHQQ
ncbi:nitroreductase/quinone reductase family protein, partial [Mycobacterium palustre]